MNRPGYAPGAMSLFVFALGLILFASPLTIWWSAQHLPWITPFAIWFALIVLIGLAIGRGSPYEL